MLAQRGDPAQAAQAKSSGPPRLDSCFDINNQVAANPPKGADCSISLNRTLRL